MNKFSSVILSVLRKVKGVLRQIYGAPKTIKDLQIKEAKIIHRKELKKVRRKEQCNAVFLMINTSTWKYDALYQELEKTPGFKPRVVIIPLLDKGIELCEKELKLCLDYCEKRKYNFLVPKNNNNEWYDIIPSLKPDLVFFTNPNPLSDPLYHLDNFKNSLTIYLPYSIRIDNLSEYSYDSLFSSLVWKNYYETELHKSLAKTVSRIKAKNVSVSGHPIIDSYRNYNHKEQSVWKPQKNEKKRIIWAPHWTIKGYSNGTLDWAAFLMYAEFMLDMAEKYFKEIQIAFKPHPFLESILSREDLWGTDKTQLYYATWRSIENGQLEAGEYVQLFMESDALIHDSGSFSVEYLEVGKPTMYTKSRSDVEKTFNELGVKAIQSHYIANNKNEIENFIKNVVIAGDDTMIENRKEFRGAYLNPNGISSSKFILNDLVRSLRMKKD